MTVNKVQSIVIYEQYTGKYEQTKQKSDRSRDENFKKETSPIIPNFIPSRSNSPNGPHILYKVSVPENAPQQSHTKQTLLHLRRDMNNRQDMISNGISILQTSTTSTYNDSITMENNSQNGANITKNTDVSNTYTTNDNNNDNKQIIVTLTTPTVINSQYCANLIKVDTQQKLARRAGTKISFLVTSQRGSITNPSTFYFRLLNEKSN